MVQNPAIMPQDPAIAEFAEELASAGDDTMSALGALGDLGSGPLEVAEEPSLESRNLDVVMRIPVSVKIVLGATSMPVATLLKLKRGAVIPLDRKVGEPVEVVVNGRVVARGDVVVIDEGSSRFGVSLTEIISPSSAARA